MAPFGVFPEPGKSINEALAVGKRVKIDSKVDRYCLFTGGSPGWTSEILKELGRLQELCGRLQAWDPNSEDWRGENRIRLFTDAVTKADALAAGSGRPELHLFRKILEDKTLANALNELLALFTPAPLGAPGY